MNHQLLSQVLEFHNIPSKIKVFVKMLYQDFQISIAGDGYVTSPITVQKGVLQGDCLSPLLFNMYVNTLIQTIDDEKQSAWAMCTKTLFPESIGTN